MTYAFDSSLTTGSAGIRITRSPSGATTLDNFAAASIPAPAAQTLPFSDDFTTSGTLYTTTTSSNQLDANWVEAMGNFKDTGAGAAVGNTASNMVATVSGVNDADVAVSADVTLAVGQSAGLVARYTVAGTFYMARIQQASATRIVASIYRFSGGGWTVISGATGLALNSSANTPDSLTFEVEGPNLKLFLTNIAGTSLIAYAVDYMLASGSVGIYAAGAASIANFNATAITSGQTLDQAQPFTDNFTPGTFANQLSTANWVELVGNYNISTGNAVSQAAGYNVASAVITAPVSDVTVQATVTTTAYGQYAGLIARSSATTGKYYVGLIEQTTTVVNHVVVPAVVATIFRNAPGSAVQIATPMVIPNIAIGASDNLVFQVEGPSLKLFLNGNLVAHASDTLLTSGSVGIYSFGAGVAFNGGIGFDASVVISGTSLPLNEAFNEATPANQLPTVTWVEQAGNFSIASGTGATPQVAGLNVAAVILSSTATDVSVQS